MNIQRYRFGRSEVIRHDNGEWVYYDDAKVLLDKIAALQQEVKVWRDTDELRGEEDRISWSQQQKIHKAMDATDALDALDEGKNQNE